MDRTDGFRDAKFTLTPQEHSVEASRVFHLQLVSNVLIEVRCKSCMVVCPRPMKSCGAYKCPADWEEVTAPVKPEWFGVVVDIVHDVLNEWPRYTGGSEPKMREKIVEAVKNVMAPGLIMQIRTNWKSNFGGSLDVELTYRVGKFDHDSYLVRHVWDDPWKTRRV